MAFVNKTNILILNSTKCKVMGVLGKLEPLEENVVEECENRDNFPYTYMNDFHSKKCYNNVVSGNAEDNLKASMKQTAKLVRNGQVDLELLKELREMQVSGDYLKMMISRRKLPSYKMKNEIIKLIDEHQVVLISGETGCGKTTQIAQFILDDAISKLRGSVTKIICTQPRRIATIAVAQRVAAERAETVGNSVGYQIRLEKVEPREFGNILFCTAGILLQFLVRDPALNEYSHIVLDEIHERNKETDLILTLLKRITALKKDLKVILMSATIDANKFSKYFNYCPLLNIEGFSYPVKELYLEDVLQVTGFRFSVEARKFNNVNHETYVFQTLISKYISEIQSTGMYSQSVLHELKNWKTERLSLDLILALTTQICRHSGPGAILIFLPGIKFINELDEMIQSSRDYYPTHPSYKHDSTEDLYDNHANPVFVYKLYSKMATSEQQTIFDIPPKGVRKIIIATSIAETSITIDDVVYVIDSGKTKTLRFDFGRKIYTLDLEWISDMSARQRKGRAGRSRPGVCYHLFTKARRNTFAECVDPEILRSCLDEVILQMKLLEIQKVEGFFKNMMDPPKEVATKLSLELLRSINALDDNDNLTQLGYYLAHLPVEPKIGKMVLLGAIFSCIEPIFSIAASLSFKDAFYSPSKRAQELHDQKLELASGHFSDHLILSEALARFGELDNSECELANFCDDYFLCKDTMYMLVGMKSQFVEFLHEMKFLNSTDPRDKSSNRNSSNKALVKAIICAGVYPNIAMINPCGGLITLKMESAKIHVSSINEKIQHFSSPYVTYFLSRKYGKTIYLHDTTSVSPMAVILATPKYAIEETRHNVVINISGVMEFCCDLETARIIETLHRKFNQLLQRKFQNPGPIEPGSPDDQILSAVIDVISDADKQMGL